MKVAQELKDRPFNFLWYDLREYAIEKMEDAISVLLGVREGVIPFYDPMNKTVGFQTKLDETSAKEMLAE